MRGIDVERPLNDYIRDAFFVPPKRPPQRQRRDVPQKRESNWHRKKRLYAETQVLFRKRQGECARRILDGEQVIDVVDVEGFLREWEGTMTGAVLPVPPSPMVHGDSGIDLFYPISATEIKSNSLPLSSAPGPDGFTARQLRSAPALLLRVLLNLLMVLKKVPTSLKGARTIFIPKKYSASLPSDFRPITVAPVLLRLLNKILTQRASQMVKLDFRQWAFLPVDGCAENVILLSATIQEARRSLRPLHLASVDLAKAFDKVSKAAIIEGVRRAGLGESFALYVTDLYEGANTLLTFQGHTRLVGPTAGVRQGDPLSLFLFNLVIDGFFKSMEGGIGFSSGNFNMDAMAFADDLIVFASTPMALQRRLDELDCYLGHRGLAMNKNKSFTLSLVPSGKEKKMKVSTDRKFQVAGVDLPKQEVSMCWKYLGVPFDPRRKEGYVRTPGRC